MSDMAPPHQDSVTAIAADPALYAEKSLSPIQRKFPHEFIFHILVFNHLLPGLYHQDLSLPRMTPQTLHSKYGIWNTNTNIHFPV